MRDLRVLKVASGEIHLLASVHGLLREAARVERAFAAARPDVVAVGVAPAELEGLESHLRGEGDEEDEGPETIDPSEVYATGLARYGDIALPPPDLLAAVASAKAASIPVESIDLDGTQYDEVFSTNVGAWQLFRYGRRLRRMQRRPIQAPSAEAYAIAWDARIRRLKGFEAVERARELQMATRLEWLASRGARVLAVVDVARAEGVERLLAKRNP